MMTAIETGAPASDQGSLEMTYQRQGNSSPATEPEQRNCLNPTSKRAAVLRVFLERGDNGLNCFEAVRLAHDYILRTTVSECRRYHGIEFHKRFEQVPGHNGSSVDCVRYSLTGEGARKVRELLDVEVST